MTAFAELFKSKRLEMGLEFSQTSLNMTNKEISALAPEAVLEDMVRSGVSPEDKFIVSSRDRLCRTKPYLAALIEGEKLDKAQRLAFADNFFGE